jgi:hypothetical protein
MAATMTSAQLQAAASRALSRNPAWVGTRGPQGARGAVQSTFVQPVARGAVWIHENNGVAYLYGADPRLVVEHLQRTANRASERAGGRGVAVDGKWGPETRAGLLALTGDPDAVLSKTLMEDALRAAFHGGAGIVVIPLPAQLPAFTTVQAVTPMPNGNLSRILVAQSGTAVEPGTAENAPRAADGAVAPSPALAAPQGGGTSSSFVNTSTATPQDGAGGGLPPGTLPVCDPRLAIAAVVPGNDPVLWAQMSNADRFKAWERWIGDDPANRSWPFCVPGQFPTPGSIAQATGQTSAQQGGAPPMPLPGQLPAPQQANALGTPRGGAPAQPAPAAQPWGLGKVLAVAGGFAGFGYVLYVAAREIKNPSPDPRSYRR